MDPEEIVHPRNAREAAKNPEEDDPTSFTFGRTSHPAFSEYVEDEVENPDAMPFWGQGLELLYWSKSKDLPRSARWAELEPRVT